MLTRQSTSAGAYQQERYEDGLRAWRRRILPPLRWFTVATLLGCFAYLALGPATKVQFTAGLIAGGFFALYVWVRDEPPEHIKRHKHGAEGERATAKALRPLLKHGWHAVHDIDTGRGNRDHVLVGPGGVFLLDSKKFGGISTVENNVVLVERPDDERDSYALQKLAGATRGEAARLHAEILAATGISEWVTAIVVFWSPFPMGIVEGDQIIFIHGNRLAQWLQSRPTRCNKQTITRIVATLE